MKTLKCQLCRELSWFPFFCHHDFEFKHETQQSAVKSIPYDQIPWQLMDVLLSSSDEYEILKALWWLGNYTSRCSPLNTGDYFLCCDALCRQHLAHLPIRPSILSSITLTRKYLMCHFALDLGVELKTGPSGNRLTSNWVEIVNSPQVQHFSHRGGVVRQPVLSTLPNRSRQTAQQWKKMFGETLFTSEVHRDRTLRELLWVFSHC